MIFPQSTLAERRGDDLCSQGSLDDEGAVAGSQALFPDADTATEHQNSFGQGNEAGVTKPSFACRQRKR
jgi:hypothetical protein